MSFGFVPHVAAETTDKIGSNVVNKNDKNYKVKYEWIWLESFQYSWKPYIL